VVATAYGLQGTDVGLILMGYRALLRLLNLCIVSSDIDEPSSSCGLGCLLIQGNRLRQFLGSLVFKSEVLSKRKKERRGIPLRIHVGHLLKQEVLCVGTLCWYKCG